MAFDFEDLTPEQIQKGLACKSVDEFQAFVKSEGFGLDEEARALFEDIYEMELSSEALDAVAGGTPWDGCDKYECKSYRTRMK